MPYRTLTSIHRISKSALIPRRVARFSKVFVLWEDACFPVCILLLFPLWWNCCLLFSLLLPFNNALASHWGFGTNAVCGLCWVWLKKERKWFQTNKQKKQHCKWSINHSKWQQIVIKHDKEFIFMLYLGNLWMLMRLFHFSPWAMSSHCCECCMDMHIPPFFSCLNSRFMDYLFWCE